MTMATRFNTGNPIDSNDPRDGSDNMANLDQMVNSAGQTFTDRFGASRKTLTGYDTEIQSRVDNAVASWVQPDNTGDWATGTAYTEGQLWKEAGEYYFVLADYTSGASAAADIAAGRVAEYTNTARQRVKTSISDLEASTPFYDGEAIYLSAGGRSGIFEWLVGDYSAEVAADPLQGVYIESSSISASVGCWVWSGATVSPAQFDGDESAALNVASISGKQYVAPLTSDVTGCVIRNSGSGWDFIDDEEHAPYGFDTLDVNVTEQYAITVHRTNQADKRITASVTSDETLSLVGMQSGPSVNDDNIRLKLAAPLTARFAVSSAPTFTEISSFHSSPSTISWDATNGWFDFNHLSCGLSGQPVVSYNFGAHTAVEEPVIASSYRVNNELTRICLYMDLTVNASFNGSSWAIRNREIGRNSNSQSGYSVSFSSQTFTVNHPEIATRVFSDDATITFHGGAGNSEFYVAKVLNTTNRTSVQFQVYDMSTGAIMSSVPSGFKFTVKRGLYRVPRPLGGHISVSLPYTRIDPQDVVSSTGNIWIQSQERY